MPSRMGSGIVMVNLYVGNKKQHFQVPKDILCNRIPFFDKMFNGRFAEAASQVATFPDDIPTCFENLLRWVYDDIVPSPNIMKSTDGSIRLDWEPVDFYFLAEKLCLIELQDRVMDVYLDMCQKLECVMGRQSLISAYENTSEKSGLRKLAVYTVAQALQEGGREEPWSISIIQDILYSHEDFLRDLLELQRSDFEAGGGKVADPRQMSRCTFHSHGTTEHCYMKRKDMIN